jgi:Magnesium chelatase, subunit ChlI C-terminal
MLGRVERAREIQAARGQTNSRVPKRLIRKQCAPDETGERTLEMAMRRMSLSDRAHDRILKVAPTGRMLRGQREPGTLSAFLVQASYSRSRKGGGFHASLLYLRFRSLIDSQVAAPKGPCLIHPRAVSPVRGCSYCVRIERFAPEEFLRYMRYWVRSDFFRPPAG